MSVSASIRLFSTKFPQSLNPNFPILKTLILSPTPFPTKLSFPKSISIQGIPTKPLPLYSSPSSSSSTPQPIEDLPPSLQEIVQLFQSVPESKAKYEQLLFYGRTLKPLDTQFKSTENKVQGCVSQVWVRASLDSNKNVIFEADSDSVLTKGLAALLVKGLSGRPVQEILRVSPDFVLLLGLQQSLSPSRNNGFLNMLKLMQKKALQLYVEAEKESELGNQEPVKNSKILVHNSNSGSKNNNGVVGISSEGGIDESRSTSGVLGSRGVRIRERLERELNAIELEVEDTSYQHAGHAGVRGSNGETHFNVRVVSKEFEGKSLVKRHRVIYGLLKDELEGGLHALSIEAKTPSEVGN
ncbi:hypothetical protein LguiA_023451 [Lonicera macranthoides]